MRRPLSYILIFAVGAAACFGLLRMLNVGNAKSSDRALQSVVNILERKPAAATVQNDMFIKASGKIEPSVVNIDTVISNSRTGEDPFSSQFERGVVQGKGSGVIISPDGYLVTNNHVVEGATTIRVTLPDKRQFEGKVVGTAAESDLAVVKIDGSGFPSADMGDSDRLQVGEFVIAVGYPLGIGTTVTHGIISAVDRKDLPVGDGRVIRQAVQTDAPINRGNSGGALANLSGQLVGINTAIASENGGGNIGIGFAIPSNVVRDVALRIIRDGKAVASVPAMPFMGVDYTQVDSWAAEHYNLAPGEGVKVREVRPLSSAADAGLQPYDIILEIDGKKIMAFDDVKNTIAKHQIGDKIILRVLRDDGQHELPVTLRRRPDSVMPRG
jgi:serine protease Do